MKVAPLIAGVALLAPLALAAPAIAQSNASGTLSSSDQQFLQTVAQEDRSEVTLAQLAQQKSPNAQVKSYAQTILSNDPSMQSQAEHIAQNNRASISTTPSASEHEEYTDLSNLSGEKFDHAYLKYEANRQEHDLDLMQREIKNTNDQHVKDFAQKQEPTVRQAATKAKDLATSMGVSVTPS